jgi:WD40 repeat protein
MSCLCAFVASTQPIAAQAVPVKREKEARRDRYGDPLPPGAIMRLGSPRFRVPGDIGTLAFTADGKIIAASSYGRVFLIEAESGKTIKTVDGLQLGGSGESCIAFSQDGKSLASRCQVTIGEKGKEVVRVWDVTGQREPRDHDAARVIRLSWSAEGEPLAICVEAGVLCLHELNAGRSRRFECKELPRLELAQYVISAFTPQGRTLAAAEANRRVIHVWDSTTGQERHVLRLGDPIYSLAVSPDGSRLVTSGPSSVQMWDLTKGEAIYTVDNKDRYGLPLFSADGNTLAISNAWTSIRFWDAETGKERGQTKERYSFAATYCFSGDGKTLATAERNSGAIHLFDVATGERRPEPAGHTNRPHGAVFSRDGRRVTTAGALDGTIYTWDLATGESLRCLSRRAWVRDIALSPDGRTLYASWTGDEVWVCNADTLQRQHVIKLEDPDRPDTRQSAVGSHLSGDGKTLVALSYYYASNNTGGPLHGETLITGWDATTRKQLFRRRQPGQSSATALSDDARILATPHPVDELSQRRGAVAGPMRLEDAATGDVLTTFPAIEGQTRPAGFSPDSRVLVANHYARREIWFRLFETMTAGEILSFNVPSNARHAFSQGNRLFAMSAPAQEILIWDLARNCEVRRFKGFGTEVTWLAFAPDGRTLISGLGDSTLLVWDLGPREKDARKLGADGLAKAWADLAGADAKRAFEGRGTLALSPQEAIAFMKDKLRRAEPADAQRLRRLLSDLDSNDFAVRARAQANLEELGDLAEPALRKALADQPTLEFRRRVEQTLQALRGPVARPDLLRPLRAVAVLEDIGLPMSSALLEELASGAAESRLTQEARASLERLKRNNKKLESGFQR